MSSQQNGSSSQRNDDTQPSNGGAEQPGGSQPAQQAAGQPHPHPQQGPQDVFGMLANILPQAMEGIVNSMLAGGGGSRQAEQPATNASPNAQPAPPAMGGLDRLMDVMRQQHQMWEDMGERIHGMPQQGGRGMDEARQNNDPIGNMFAQLEGVLGRPAGAVPAAATAAPINFIEHLTAAAAGLAGTGAAGGQGQSFMERLQAAAAAGAAHAPQPGTSNPQQNQPQPPPIPGARGYTQTFVLPNFGGARIEITGMPGNLNEMIRQMREGFDPSASSGSRIPDEHLARLPNSSVKQHHVDDGKQCFICMDQYTEVDERVAEMTCGHIFHTDCIVPWLKRNTTCPVCRAEVVSKNWIHDELDLD